MGLPDEPKTCSAADAIHGYQGIVPRASVTMPKLSVPILRTRIWIIQTRCGGVDMDLLGRITRICPDTERRRSMAAGSLEGPTGIVAVNDLSQGIGRWMVSSLARSIGVVSAEKRVCLLTKADRSTRQTVIFKLPAQTQYSADRALNGLERELGAEGFCKNGGSWE